MINNLDSVCKINDIEYHYNVLLSNDNKKYVQLTQDCVKLLVIEDSTFNPFVDGYIIIDNDNHSLQRVYSGDDGEENESSFDFNLSERDYVYISIVPKFTKKQNKKDINQEVWNLNYMFTIYDIEDYDTGTVKGNAKKLYLMDAQKFELVDKTSKFSTANIRRDDQPPQYLRDDSDRTEFTGNIIKNIIQEVNPKAVFDDNWDQGSNKVFYTSPANRNYNGDLNYIYSIHQSEVDNDFCILSKQRYSEKWFLQSFQNIVEKALDQSDKTKAGVDLMEAFTIADTANNTIIPLKSKVPTNYGINYNTSFGDLSKIEKFELIEMSKMDKSDFIKSKVAHTYDFDDGKFEINHFDISDTKDFYDQKYLNKLNSKNSLMGVGYNQLHNKNIEHIYASKYQSDNSYEFLTRNMVLKSQYTLNVGIEFESIGMTNRQSGKFFSIRKDHKYYDNEYEGKLQGIWYCTNVTHIFTGTGYTNNISGIKLNLS